MTAHTLCELHNLPVYADERSHPGACLTCQTVTGECDFGGCTRPAVVTVQAELPRGAGGSVRDSRPACAVHACEIGAAYRRVDMIDVYVTNSGQRHYTANPWRKWSEIHRDFRGIYGGRRMVMSNVQGETCLTPWLREG